MFVRARDVRSLRDWFQPVERCEVDNFNFEREPGFYLLAIWAIDYVVAAAAGAIALVVMLTVFDASNVQVVSVMVASLLVAGLLAARKAKALFLAVDLLTDPLDPLRGEGPPGVGRAQT